MQKYFKGRKCLYAVMFRVQVYAQFYITRIKLTQKTKYFANI